MLRYASVALALISATIACGDDAANGGGGSSQGGTAQGAGTSQGAAGGIGVDDDGVLPGGNSASGGHGSGGGGAGQGGGTSVLCSGLSGTAGDTDYMLDWEGETRTFRVHAPPAYDATSGTPLVMVLHGYTE